MESVTLTYVIDPKEDQDLATIDVPNFFIQIPIDSKTGEEKIMVKIKGVTVDILVQMNPKKYGHNVVYEKGNKLLYL